jgi:hypothetical protein
MPYANEKQKRSIQPFNHTKIIPTLRAVAAAKTTRRSAPGKPRTGGDAARTPNHKPSGAGAPGKQARRQAERRSLPAADRRRAAETLRALRRIEPSAGRHVVESISDAEADYRRRHSYGV